MKVYKQKIKNLYLINKNIFKDKRGFFYRDFCDEIFKKNGINFQIKQVNIAHNKTKYTLRGFHYQKGKSKEKKIITCLKGKAVVYIVNLNKKSNYYLKPIKYIISEKNKMSILIPENFANAYLTLEKNTSFLYYMSNFYNKSQNYGIRYNDPKLNIKWPFKPKKISQKDLNFKNINF